MEPGPRRRAPAHRDVPTREIDGELVVVDPTTGVVTHLDQLGTVIWHLLDGSATHRELVDDLAAAFDAPTETVEHDLVRYLRELDGAGLLEPS